MTSPTDELAALRARAYGPDADIAGDPAALARLRELETWYPSPVVEAALGPSYAAAPPVPPPEPELAPARSGSATDRDPEVATAEAGDRPDVARPAPRPISRRWLVVWAASILVVALAVGGSVWAMASVRSVSPQTGATQVATLDATVEADWLRAWFGDAAEDVRTYAYRGLTVAVLPNSRYFGNAGRCLLVADASDFDADQQQINGMVYQGCEAGAFPATVEFVVDASAPGSLTERHPVGTSLQFVLDGDADGDVVGVFAVDRPEPTATAG